MHLSPVGTGRVARRRSVQWASWKLLQHLYSPGEAGHLAACLPRTCGPEKEKHGAGQKISKAKGTVCHKQCKNMRRKTLVNGIHRVNATNITSAISGNSGSMALKLAGPRPLRQRSKVFVWAANSGSERQTGNQITRLRTFTVLPV